MSVRPTRGIDAAFGNRAAMQLLARNPSPPHPMIRCLRLSQWSTILVTGFAACAAPGVGTPPPEEPSARGPSAGEPARCGGPYTPAWQIQGTDDRSAVEGRPVVVEGIVVGDFEGPDPALGGFYLQDLRGDGDPSTSDAVFVTNEARAEVQLGDRVRVVGRVEERQGQTTVVRANTRTTGRPTGLAGDAAFADTVLICARGVPIAPTDVVLPLPAEGWPERLEGMLVRFPQPLHVTELYRLGRYGEVMLSAGGRLPQPTDVAPPGPAARAVQAANDHNRILLDDAGYAENPDPIPFGRGGDPLTAENTLRGGDVVTGLVGVLTWTAADGPGPDASGHAWRVRPIGALDGGAPDFFAANRRVEAPSVAGSTRVGSFNLLNYFDTFDGCTGGVGGAPADCRGADGPEAFERQWRKIVPAISRMGVDVLGVMEIENDGYGPESAIAHLVARLNDAHAADSTHAADPQPASEPDAARGAPAEAVGPWSFVDVDARTGTRNALGTDAIKVGLLYRADRVRPVGRTAVLATRAFVTGGDSEPRNRPSLAQAFETAEGERFVVDVNHLKSKGSPCDDPDAGDGQGNCNAVRTAGARELAAWLASDPTRLGDPDALILGDLNAYAREDPLRALRDAGYVDLVASRLGPEAHSYVFGGQWGTLDHALASPSLADQVAGTTVWHVNADEPPVLDYRLAFKSPAQQASLYAPDPFRSSDHDPVIVGLELGAGGR